MQPQKTTTACDDRGCVLFVSREVVDCTVDKP